MSIKRILVMVSDDASRHSAVTSAFLVSRVFQAHVVGLHLTTVRDQVTAEDMVDLRSNLRPLNQDVLQMLKDSVREEPANVRDARQAFMEISEAMGAEIVDRPPPQSGPSATFKTEVSSGPQVIASYGRVFDLIVLPQPRNDPRHELREIVRAALFDSGRPVLVVPRQVPSSIGERALIAWNGSTLSARAAAISRQYFYKAQKVGILSVGVDSKAEASVQDLAEYFAWHGIEVDVIEVPAGQKNLGDSFLAEASKFKADLLVMGAYAKSPFRESLTRGVTNHILSHAEIPVLMTH